MAKQVIPSGTEQAPVLWGSDVVPKLNQNFDELYQGQTDIQADADAALSAAGAAQSTANNAQPKETGKGLYPSDDATRLVNTSGNNTGDETGTSIKTKLGVTTLSGSNTGDETASSIVTKIGNGTTIGSQYLPAYVDDVLEFSNLAALPTTGETGKIYVTIDTNYEYRWSGSTYIRLVASPGSTDAVPEGTTNQYYTDARAQAANASLIANKVSRTDFANLTFGSTVNWDAGDLQLALAKTTATASFTLNVTNLKLGANATFAVIINTSTKVTVSFTGNGLTFKQGALNPLISYELPIGTGRTYLFSFVNISGNVEVFVNDFVSPVISGGMIAELDLNQSTAITATTAGVYYPMSFNTVAVKDTAGMFDGTNPIQFVIKGSVPVKVIGVLINNWQSTASATPGYRRAQILINGVSSAQPILSTASAGLTWSVNSAFQFNANPNDVIRIESQSSLAGLTFSGSVRLSVFSAL